MVGLILYAIVKGSLWFAPALIAFHGLTAMAAIRWSLYAALSNLGAMLTYLLVLSLAYLVAAIPWGLGFIIAVPVMCLSTYTGYRDVFEKQRKGQPLSFARHDRRRMKVADPFIGVVSFAYCSASHLVPSRAEAHLHARIEPAALEVDDHAVAELGVAHVLADGEGMRRRGAAISKRARWRRGVAIGSGARRAAAARSPAAPPPLPDGRRTPRLRRREERRLVRQHDPLAQRRAGSRRRSARRCRSAAGRAACGCRRRRGRGACARA